MGFSFFTDILTSTLKTDTPGFRSSKSFNNDYFIYVKDSGEKRRMMGEHDQSSDAIFKPADGKLPLRLYDVPRAIEYCNSPLEPVTGTEGNTDTVVPTKSDRDVILCLQLLSKILRCTLHFT